MASRTEKRLCPSTKLAQLADGQENLPVKNRFFVNHSDSNLSGWRRRRGRRLGRKFTI